MVDSQSSQRANWIAGEWIRGEGDSFISRDPASGQVVWSGNAATTAEVSRAVGKARAVFPQWMRMGADHRIACLRAYARSVVASRDRFAHAISRETGKPKWEAMAEVDLMAAKVELTIQAWRERQSPAIVELDHAAGVTRYRPLGATATIGPFNLPGHVPNGHIVPALLAGNTVVFKPSDKTPLSAVMMAECFEQAELPPGAFNLVQGGKTTAEALVAHRDIDGVFFTGSHAAGCAISRLLADRPEVLVALEMGGNNPLVVHRAGDMTAAAYLTVQSAFVTAGQRCTCARRLIVVVGEESDRFLHRLVEVATRIRVGSFDESPEPFMGPVIAPAVADRLLESQQSLLDQGAKPLLTMRRCDERRRGMLSPGIVDVTSVAQRRDEEMFGPLLSVIRVPDFDAAIDEANRSRYGLSAALFSDERALFDTFVDRVRAGCVNWNRPTSGLSGRLPFGGVGKSGNHRPTGYHAVDYCAYPVASIEQPQLVMPDKRTPGID